MSSAPQTRLPMSPWARTLCRRHDVDAHRIVGTGPRGRVTGEDVRNHLRRRTSRLQRFAAEVAAGSDNPAAYTLQADVDLSELEARLGATVATATAATVAAHLIAAAAGTTPRETGRVGVLVDAGDAPAVLGTRIDDLGDLAGTVQRLTALIDRWECGRTRPDDLAPVDLVVWHVGAWGVEVAHPFTVPLGPLVLMLGRCRSAIRLADGEVRARPVATATLTADARRVPMRTAADALVAIVRALEAGSGA